MQKEKKPSPIDPIKGIDSAQTRLFYRINILQELLEDVLGLKESRAVWKRNAESDTQYRSSISSKISKFMKTHTEKEVAKFLRDGLYEYYTRRISLARALEKIGNIEPSSSGLNIVATGRKAVHLDEDIIEDMRKSISQMGEIHRLLLEILKVPLDPDSVDNKSLCDDAYLADLVKDCSLSPAGMFLNAHRRFSDMIDEIKSAERQIEKLKERICSYRKSSEIDREKKVLKDLEQELESLKDSPEIFAVRKNIIDLRTKKRNANLNGGSSADGVKIDCEINIAHKKLDALLKSPEIIKATISVKEQRKKIMSLRDCPESKAAEMLMRKRMEAVDILKKRLVSEAERFCKTRNEILETVDRAMVGMASKCRDLPDAVRDVFRNNPPTVMENISAMNYKLSFKN